MRDTFENHRLRTCIWLINLLEKKSMSLAEIKEAWLDNEDLSRGIELQRRTFINYKNAIWDIFHILIECDTNNGYRYSITMREDDDLTDWLRRSVSLSDTIASNTDLKDRILLEKVPSGDEYLTTILNAMRENKKIKFEYQRFHDLAPQHIKGDPYCVKIFQQRWYVLVKEYRTVLASHEIKEEMRVYSFDRMSELEVLEDTFKMDKDFNAKDFFKYAWGVRVDEEDPIRLVLKVKSEQCPYFRTLPLHHTQKEIETKGRYSLFEYMACPTIEMILQIMHYGPLVEVIEPQELRDEIGGYIREAADQYDHTAEESLAEPEEDEEEILSPEEEELQQAIKTKEQLLEYIDSKLTDEDRKELLDPESDVHFGLGTWLRNLIIYPRIIDVEALLDYEPVEEINGFEIPRFFNADMASSELIGAVREYLSEKYKK